jgi:BlaI family penicillinase repressor
MAKLAKPSGPELEVAQIVFRLGECRVRDVVAALPPERMMDFSTVQTYLRRLKAKGYLTTRREGRADVYRAAVKEKSVVREVVGELVERLFGGDSLPLMQHLIADRNLTPQQLDQLQAMLDTLKSQRKGKR